MRHHGMRALAGLLLLSASGCVSVQVYPLPGAPALAARSQECLVEAFRTQPPARPYVEVARVEAVGGAPDTLEEALRQKACAIGADAVVVTGEGVHVWEGKGTPTMKGMAVKYAPAAAPASR